MIRILSLVENTAGAPGLLGEHGLAMWIEIGGKNVLFDTGQGGALLPNAQQLGVPLERTNAIVLSHGHYDHTGGLAAALERTRKPTLYAHPDAFEAKFACDPGGARRDIGIAEADRNAARERTSEVIATKGPVEIVPGLFATGPVPRETEYEKTSGPFFLDPECRRPDPMNDDQALFFDTNEGTVVLLGCAHAGVVNTLVHVQRLAGGKPIREVIGGMHLGNASQERLDRTVEAFREMDIQCLRPAHCTGAHAVARIRDAFPDRCESWPVGTRTNFAGAPSPSGPPPRRNNLEGEPRHE